MFSLVIPTYNEKKTLQALLPRLRALVSRLPCPVEIIVVDDNSPDGTAEFAHNFAMPPGATIRVVSREGKLGLASAVIEGWRSSRGSVLGVMDADGAHDESILLEMLQSVLDGPAEIAIGSRFVPGGGIGDWPLSRKVISLVAVYLGRILCPARDSTSNYLVFTRDVLEGVSLDPNGVKIGLEVMIRGRYRIFTEIPYVFSAREKGTSPVRIAVMAAYLKQLGNLMVYRYRYPHQRRRWTRVVS